MDKELISCVCMTCGKRNDHTDPDGLCPNGGHDNWLEYRDVISRNEHFEHFARNTGIDEDALYSQFMDNSIKSFPVLDKPFDKFTKAIDNAGVKITFGLQPKHIEIIETELAKYDQIEISGKTNPGSMLYSSHFWEDIGKKVGWLPITIALYYLRYRNEANAWHKYPEERPTDYGKYEVYRAGCKKQIFQTWNNSSWAYDNKDITHWRKIIPPIT